MEDSLHSALLLPQMHLTCGGLVNSLSLASFSGICGEGAYMIDAYGIQQPSSHAYRMLDALGETELARGAGWVLTRDGQGHIRAMAWSDPDNEPALLITGLRPNTRLMRERLDETHGWAYPVWQQMGCPRSLSRYQAQALRHAALHTDITWMQTDAQGNLTWNLPAQGAALMLLKE
jgi:xylan 1,4-beta-xylosidase